MPIDPKSVTWDAPEPAGIVWDDEKPKDQPGALTSIAAGLGKGVGNVALGAQNLLGRGISALGGIGQERRLQDLIVGPEQNIVQRAGRWLQEDAAMGREKLAGELAPYKEANPLAAGAGELGGEIVSTLPVGGFLAKGAQALGAGGKTVNALRSAGMTTGAPAAATLAGRVADVGLRAGAGAAVGGASTALIDPEQTGTGALLGAAMPGALQLAGRAGQKIGSVFRGPEQSPELVAAIQKAREAGYVIPPSQARASLLNRGIEGMSGKITTAQNASARNQAVTNAKVAESIGLPSDTVITPEVLDAIRSEAGQAYGAISRLGAFDATRAKLPASVRVAESNSPLLFGKTRAVDSGEVVRAWKQANADATSYYRAYARDANPETLAKAKSAASEASQIDDFLVKQVEAAQEKMPQKLIADLASGRIGQDDFLRQAVALGQQGNMAEALKAARVRIAKTYSAEAAMNPVTGTIDARKLAKQLEKGKPLSGGLREAAEFAGRFPKAAQPLEGMGSLPQTSPLDWTAAGVAGLASGGNPLSLLGLAARPAARATALSPMIQNRLVQPSIGGGLLDPDSLNLLAHRALPGLLAGQ